MKRTPLVRHTPLRAKSPMRRTSRPKMTEARKSAKGMPCTLRYPGCYPGPDNENVVLCHLRQFGGGGTGLKPPDGEAVYGCTNCHDLLDGRKPMTGIQAAPISGWERIARALIETHRLQRAAGVLIYKGEEQ